MSLAMTRTEREQFLADLHVGIISIGRKTRGPLTVPIWYDYEPGGDVWMITSRSSIKGKLLASTKRISLCAQIEAPPYKYVSVEGPFHIHQSDEDKILHMAVRYLGEEQGKRYAAASTTGPDSIVVTLRPETWYTVDYSKR